MTGEEGTAGVSVSLGHLQVEAPRSLTPPHRGCSEGVLGAQAPVSRGHL